MIQGLGPSLHLWADVKGFGFIRVVHLEEFLEFRLSERFRV